MPTTNFDFQGAIDILNAHPDINEYRKLWYIMAGHVRAAYGITPKMFKEQAENRLYIATEKAWPEDWVSAGLDVIQEYERQDAIDDGPQEYRYSRYDPLDPRF